MLLDSSGCEAVELEKEERGKLFRCSAWREPDQTAAIQVSAFVAKHQAEQPTGSKPAPDLHVLCREAVGGRLGLAGLVVIHALNDGLCLRHKLDSRVCQQHCQFFL